MYQLKKPEKFSFDAARDGFMLMLWGYFLKIVIAVRASIIVDTVYGDIDSYHGWYLIIATMLFAVQIYCDFAGYSIIAAGSAKILGIRLMENFNAPYTAVSVTDFWRRWHISLSTWFRDYVYIPLGGNRKGALRKEWNRIIVFLLSGLWHGANLTFVVWGGINGLYQMIGDFTRPMRLKIVRMLRLRPATAGFKIYQALVTFLLIDFSWIFFRADDIHQANTIIHSIFHADNPWILLDGSLYGLGLNEKNVHLLVICIIVLLAADILKHNGICIRNILIQQDYPVRWLVFTFSIWFILTFGIWGAVYDANQFIYFQF